jgi:DNA-directed RNA polymerase I subunit RPA2
MRTDRTSVTFTLHYLSNGVLTCRFQLRRNEFFIPVIILLKALVPCTDREIYEKGTNKKKKLRS